MIEMDQLVKLGKFPMAVIDFSDKKIMEQYIEVISGKVSILKELVEIMEVHQVLEFLYLFAGQTLEIPDARVLYNAARDVDVYNSLQKKNNGEVIGALASRYSLTPQTIMYINNKMIERLKEKERP